MTKASNKGQGVEPVRTWREERRRSGKKRREEGKEEKERGKE